MQEIAAILYYSVSFDIVWLRGLGVKHTTMVASILLHFENLCTILSAPATAKMIVILVVWMQGWPSCKIRSNRQVK